MRETSTIKDTRLLISKWKSEGLSIGFVPTMGYLHEGHCSLIKRAVSENDRVVVSVFVNPAQFDREEDLNKYPVSLEEDREKIAEHGGDLVFIPKAHEIYPQGFNTLVEVTGLDKELCGATRPGHFRGVCTIVNKLFNIIQPDKAYFGEKDYQQLKIIKTMTEDLNMSVEVVGCPIVREEGGLALSSRNARLSPEERKAALVINETLKELEKRVEGGEKNVVTLKREAVERINCVPGVRVDYLEIVDEKLLQKVEKIEGESLAAAGVFVGKVRLIDNIKLG